MAVTYSRYKFVTVPLLKRRAAVSAAKRLPGSRSGLKKPVETSRKKAVTKALVDKALDIIVFSGGDDGRGYRNMCKIPRGSNSNDGG
jgi:hypothetical protein